MNEIKKCKHYWKFKVVKWHALIDYVHGDLIAEPERVYRWKI